ncbi:MAG: hypothetical protein AAFQ42_08960 [Pseudomonadota bacterium]
MALIVLLAGSAVAIDAPADAGDVEIVEAVAVAESAPDTFTFRVTLRHGDTGWEHYANAWDIVAADGTVLGKRTLFHPHVDEQPFTRSLTGVAVSPGVQEVRVRAYDSVHGRSQRTVLVKLPGR